MANSAFISAFSDLGQLFSLMADTEPNGQRAATDFQISDEEIRSKLKAAEIKNPWFTPENLKYSLVHWSQLLTEDKLNEWINKFPDRTSQKNIALIPDDRIPFSGLHDLLAVLLSGHRALIKTSPKDEILMDFVIQFLKKNYPIFEDLIFKTERLKDFDAVMATGNEENFKYFEYYFKDKPHIIRKEKTSAAILTGDETPEELKNLAEDVFVFFGLSNRNVSKLYLPKGYNTDLIFEAFYDWNPIINHHKYANNYDYNRAVYLMEQVPFLDNNFVILKEDSGFKRPLGVVFYEFYSDLSQVKKEFAKNSDQLECIVGKGFEVKLGMANRPGLTDYVNGINIPEFLSGV